MYPPWQAVSESQCSPGSACLALNMGDSLERMQMWFRRSGFWAGHSHTCKWPFSSPTILMSYTLAGLWQIEPPVHIWPSAQLSEGRAYGRPLKEKDSDFPRFQLALWGTLLGPFEFVRLAGKMPLEEARSHLPPICVHSRTQRRSGGQWGSDRAAACPFAV